MAETLSWVNINNQGDLTLINQADIKSYEFVTADIKDNYEARGVEIEFDWDYYTELQGWASVYQNGIHKGYIQWDIVQSIWNGDE